MPENNGWVEVPLDEEDEWVDITPKEDSALQTAKDFQQGISDSTLFSGAIDKAADFTNASIDQLVDLFSDRPDKTFSEHKEKWANLRAQDRAEREGRSPMATITGEVVGALAGPGGAAKTALGRIGSTAAMGAADQATQEDTLSDAITEGGKGLATAGGLSAGFEAIPKVGRTAGKIAKKILPGTEESADIVNKATANVGQFMPGSSTKQDIYQLLSDVKARRRARGLQKQLSKGKDNLVEDIGQLADDTSKQMGDIYRGAETDFLEQVGNKQATIDTNDLDSIVQIAEQRPAVFPQAKKVLSESHDIIQRGGPSELVSRASTAGKGLDTIDPETASKRLLEARRHLDHLQRGKDFKSMTKGDQSLIRNYRQGIQQQLESLPGGEKLREADQLFSEFTSKHKDAFEKLQVRSPGGKKEFSPEKIEKFVQSSADQWKPVNRSINEFAEFITKNKQFKPDTTQVVDTLNTLRDDGQFIRALETLERSGGPTGQGTNAILQFLMGSTTGGASLLAYPATNPSGWMKLVDSLDNATKTRMQPLFKFMEKVWAPQLRSALVRQVLTHQS